MDQVCGSDCRMYFNDCHFKNRACKTMDSHVLSVFRRGECPPRVAPRVLVSSEGGKDVMRGNHITITCYVASSQDHVITWTYHDNVGNTTSAAVDTISTTSTVVSASVVQSVSTITLSDAQVTHSGRYTCTARMCGDTAQAALTITISDYPKCSLLSGGHITTFDGLSFISEFHGDFILAMDIERYQWFIYGRFKQCYEGSPSYCLSSITVHDSHSPLSFHRKRRVHGPGNLWRVVEEGETLTRDHKTMYVRDGKIIMVLYGGTVTIGWDGYMSAYIINRQRARTGGLCGNNDRDPANDFIARYIVSENYDEFNNYLASWRITHFHTHKMASPRYTTDLTDQEHVVYCQDCLRSGLPAECVPNQETLELLLSVCVFELGVGATFRDRENCDVRCYLKLQLSIMCNPPHQLLQLEYNN